MSSVTPGRATDALVAEKLGWRLARPGYGFPPNCDGMKHPVVYPRPSTVEADALSALEATGKDYDLRKVTGGDKTVQYVVFRVGGGVGRGPTLCTAICAAILQLPRGEG